MQTQFSSMEISKKEEVKVEVTSKMQNSASSFCKDMPSGFGFLPTWIRFDPTYYEKEKSLHNLSYRQLRIF